MSYNGWENWATWAMALNLDNDYEIYQCTQKAIRLAAVTLDPNSAEDTEEFQEEVARIMRTQAETWIELDMMPDFKPNDAELANVDWQEIAGHYELGDYV